MIEYKKIRIKDNVEVEELDINDVEPLNSFGDIRFKDRLKMMDNAITFSYCNNELLHKAAILSKQVDWIIREYKGELYLISLKKDC